VDGILPYFRYLNFGLSVILVFIGLKMISSEAYHMPTSISLGSVGLILTVTILASYIAKRREDATLAR
jgi:tellurite resistance protein TerC